MSRRRNGLLINKVNLARRALHEIKNLFEDSWTADGCCPWCAKDSAEAGHEDHCPMTWVIRGLASGRRMVEAERMEEWSAVERFEARNARQD